MNKDIIFALLAINCLIFSCTTKTSDLLTIDMENMDEIKKQQEYQTNDVFGKVDFIPLETTDSSLFKGISALKETSQYLFVVSGEYKLYQFDIQGKFVRQVGRPGRGPEEFSVVGFDVDEDQQILYIYDYFQQKMVKYDFDGNFIETYRTPFVDGMADMQLVKPGALLLLTNTNSYSPEVFIFPEEKKELLPISRKDRPVEEGSFQMGGNKSIYTFKDTTYIRHAFNDTIFKYSDNKLQPAYLLKTLKYQYRFSELKGEPKIVEPRFEIYNMIETDGGLFVFYDLLDFRLPMEQMRKKYLMYHHKKMGMTSMNTIFKHPEIKCASIDGNYPLYAGKSKHLYAMHEAFEIAELDHPPVKVKEEDNPVLIRYTLK